jgi:K+-sensing histidine kinase KdpD
MNKKKPTYFAPAERANSLQIEEDIRMFANNPALNKIADAVSVMLVILNRQRQIIFANQLFLNFIRLENIDDVAGKRPGEALKCIHSNEEEGGCGTSEFCRTCGAVQAILESQTGKSSVKECRITTRSGDALDLRVTATPYMENGSEYTAFAIHDISHEKRRQTLERIFFHDVLNTAGSVAGLSSILLEIKDPDEITEIVSSIKQATEHMIDEIQMQQNLSAAERGDLIPEFKEIKSLELLNNITEMYSKYEIASNKCISLKENAENVSFFSDPVILRRITGNMLKNALEASIPGSTISFSCSCIDHSVRFSVHNDSYIDRKIQLQLFNRSFSTKGMGRGIGTYSMKLFGEKYLRGKVWFESSVEKGTTFFIEVPKNPDKNAEGNP